MLTTKSRELAAETNQQNAAADPADIFDEQEIAEAMSTMCEVFKHITTSSLPMIGSSSISIQFFIFGMVLIHLSENEDTLAATALIFKMFGFLLISLSPVFGSSVIIRNQLGELKIAEESEPTLSHDDIYDRISAIPKSSMLISAIAIPAAFLPFYFSDKVLVSLFRQNEELALLARNFLRIYAASVPGHAIRMPMMQLLYGFHKATPAALISLTSLGITTLLGVGLSYGWYGYPPLGEIGMAIGASAEPYLSAAAYMIYVRADQTFARFHFLSTRNHRHIPTQLKAIGRLGLPISISLIADIGSNMAYNALIGVTGGRDALIATSIMNQLNSFMMIIRPPIAQSVSLQLSFYAGHHDYKQASNFAKKGLLTSAIYTTPIPIITAAAPDILVFISGKQIDSMTFLRKLAPILGLTQIMEGLRMNLTHQMHAFNDNNIPAMISIAGTAAGITIGAVTGIYTGGGVFALTGAYASGLTVAALGLTTRWYFTSKPENIQKFQEKQIAVYQSSTGLTFFTCCKRNNKESTKLLTADEEQPSLAIQNL